MHCRSSWIGKTSFASVGLFCCFVAAAALNAEDRAETIIDRTEFTGGVVVQVHGDDASLLLSIRKQRPNTLGHLLVAQEDSALEARESLVDAGSHGQVGVGTWQSGPLPFINNFVNLLVVYAGAHASRALSVPVLATG